MPTPFSVLRQFGAAALVALGVSGTGYAATAPSTREVQRLEDLARVWIYVDLFDPYLNANGAEWDQALIDTIPSVRTAGDPAAVTAALNAMLRKSRDPTARVVEGAAALPSPLPLPLRKQGGTWIADCNALAHAVATGTAPLQLAENIAAQPTIVDCRSFAGDGNVLGTVIAAIARTRSTTTLPVGSALVRTYSGFPSESGAVPGLFAAGFSLVGKGAIPAGRVQANRHALVFILDSASGPVVLPPIAALQSAGQVRVVATESIGTGIAMLRTPRLAVQISEGLYTYPAGAVGFRPDALATPQGLMRAAVAELSASPAAILREPTLPPLQRPPRRYRDSGAVPVEQRLLALFRLWGTINYFHPNKALMDRPWDTTLAEFIPAMLAAETRGAYEALLLRLIARTHDSLTRLEGLKEPPFGFGTHHPAIQARFIEGRLAIVTIEDPTLATKLKVGDEIMSIDGTPVSFLEQRMTPFIAASTPQALRTIAANRLLSGPAGSTAALLVRSARTAPRIVRVTRAGAPPDAKPPAWRMLPGDIGYVDLKYLAPADADRAVDELMSAKALVLDLRGPTQGAGRSISARLTNADAPVPVARLRRASYQGPPRDGAAQSQWIALNDMLRPSPAQRYTGHVFALTDERTAGQAEHTALILKAAASATFVGSPTAGTLGDMTSIHLPGGLVLRFAGHDIRDMEGRQVQRVGLKPNVSVTPTLRNLRAGRDEVLEKALDLARK